MVKNVDSITGIDIIVEISRVLMENGVGISQIESYIHDLCDSFKVKEIDVFAIPQFMSITYRDEKNNNKTISVKCDGITTNLSNIESVCALIQRIKGEEEVQLYSIYEELNRMRSKTNKKGCPRILAYIGVASVFTFIFMGVGITRIKFFEGLALFLSSIACAVVIYGGDRVLSHAKVSDMFSKLFSSVLLMSVVCGADYICTQLGISLYTSYILLGSIMLIVPGVKFTNGMRDMFSGNIVSAIIQVSEAVLSTIGIAVGIIMIQKITKCTITTTSVLPIQVGVWYDVYSILLTGIGTMFFSMYFQLDTRHLILSFLAGVLTWIFYLGGQWFVAQGNFGINAAVFIPNFSAAIFATWFSEEIARSRKWPSMIVLFPAIVSLVPGGSLYNVMYAVFSETVSYADIVQMLYTAAGLCLGILAMASVTRLGMGFVDLIDIKSAEHVKGSEQQIEVKEYLRKATKLYNVARRNLQKNPEIAFDFYCAADSNYQKAIDDLGCCDIPTRNSIYTEAGINAFWQYQCMVRMNRKEEDQKEYLKIAKTRYQNAYDALSDLKNSADYERKKCILLNWMAVMEINEARHEEDIETRKNHLGNARRRLQNALLSNPRYDKAYLNTAEVCLIEAANMMGIEYDAPIYNVVPPTDIDKEGVKKLFEEIEVYLKKVIAWNPQMPNGYYKMAQLQTYRMFYSLKIEPIFYIDALKAEAEKWFLSAAKEDKANLGYLFTYREYLELVDIEMAEEINAIISCTNPEAANKWKEVIRKCAINDMRIIA